MTIRYRFLLPTGGESVFTLSLDEVNAELLKPNVPAPPQWAALEFNQCSNCPLNADEHPLCPVAHSLIDVVPQFENLVSYDRLTVEVQTEERTVTAKTDVQAALSSLIGLIMASSGCPHTRFFRPMARFHLPLANEQETVFRSLATWLLVQHFRQADDPTSAQGLEGIAEIYAQLQIVNAALTQRLRSAGKTDSALNAVVLLDLFAMIVPAAIDDSLDELRALLAPFLDSTDTA